MKKLLFTGLIMMFTGIMSAQSEYSKTYVYDTHYKGVAKVKSGSGFYGFIDSGGKETVAPTLELKDIKENYKKQ